MERKDDSDCVPTACIMKWKVLVLKTKTKEKLYGDKDCESGRLCKEDEQVNVLLVHTSF